MDSPLDSRCLLSLIDLFKYSIIQLQKWCCARPKNNGRGHRRQQDFVLSLRNVATAPCHYFLWLFRTIPFEKCCYSPLTISLLSLTPLLWAVQTRNRAHANTVWQEINIFNHNFYRSALRKMCYEEKNWHSIIIILFHWRLFKCSCQCFL